MAYTLRAALLTEIGKPLELAELEITQLTYGQVFVRVTLSGICGKQLGEIDGRHDATAPRPRPIGHEGVGIVEWCGPGVTKVKSGDKVILHWRKGDGIESDFPAYIMRSVFNCPQGMLPGGKITGGKVTTFNDWAIVSENRLTPVPADTPDEFCALLGCSLSTALGTIEHEAKVKFGESVLIIGCGGLGLNLILAARLAQAGLVHATDVHDKGTLARAMGADCFMRNQNPNKYDVVIETSGSVPAVHSAIDSIAPSGRLIMVGQPNPKGLENLILGLMLDGRMFEGTGKTIKATQGGCFNPTSDIPRYLALFNRGVIDTGKIISHVVKLDDINKGIDLVRGGHAGRVMVEMTL